VIKLSKPLAALRLDQHRRARLNIVRAGFFFRCLYLAKEKISHKMAKSVLPTFSREK
jgi:hypothetical protein